MAAGRRAGLGGIREFAEALSRIALREFANRNHGYFVLSVLGIFVGEFDGVRRLTGEEHRQRLSTGGTTELLVSRQRGERIDRQGSHIELEQRHEF